MASYGSTLVCVQRCPTLPAPCACASEGILAQRAQEAGHPWVAIPRKAGITTIIPPNLCPCSPLLPFPPLCLATAPLSNSSSALGQRAGGLFTAPTCPATFAHCQVDHKAVLTRCLKASHCVWWPTSPGFQITQDIARIHAIDRLLGLLTCTSTCTRAACDRQRDWTR